jgi:hypothetical protein
LNPAGLPGVDRYQAPSAGFNYRIAPPPKASTAAVGPSRAVQPVARLSLDSTSLLMDPDL